MSCLSSESFASSSSGISSASSLHSSHHSTETASSNTIAHIPCGELSTANSICSSTTSTLQITDNNNSDSDDRQTPQQQLDLDTNVLEIQPHKLVIGVCSDDIKKLDNEQSLIINSLKDSECENNNENLKEENSGEKGILKLFIFILFLKLR